MRIIHLLIGAGALSAAAMATAAPRLRGEARLAQVLAGREAGKPVSCIYLHDIQSSEIIDRTAIVYRGNNGVLYVNRPEGGASTLQEDDILLTKTSIGQLCRIDTVDLIDRVGHFERGFVSLNDFVPYPRPPKRH